MASAPSRRWASARGGADELSRLRPDGQPDDWARVTARLGDFRAALPARGARVAVLGCGTSYYTGQAYAARREDAGHGETDAFPASEQRLSRSYDAVLVISRSRTTTEVITVLESLQGRGIPTTAIVATPRTEITRLVDHAILLSDVDEESVVQTRFRDLDPGFAARLPGRGPRRGHHRCPGRPRAGRGDGSRRGRGRRAGHLRRTRLDRRPCRRGRSPSSCGCIASALSRLAASTSTPTTPAI